jgi:hypothetical protein
MQQHHLHTAIILPASLLALAGCAVDRSHDLGDEPAQRTANVEQDTPPEQPLAEHASDFDGVWIGEAEDPLSRSVDAVPYAFPSGSTRILLELSSTSFTASRITFGEGPALPAPANPDVVYPEGAEGYIRAGHDIEPWEGYAYTANTFRLTPADIDALDPSALFSLREYELQDEFIAEGRVADGRLTVSYDPYELFRPWCELQPADSTCRLEHALAGGDTSLGIGPDGPCELGGEETDCGRALLCSNICLQMADDHTADLALQLTLDGLVGVFTRHAVFRNSRGFLAPLGSVRFRRVEAAD